jgi:hypothetical protein
MFAGEQRQPDFSSVAQERKEGLPLRLARFGHVSEARLVTFFLTLSLEQRIARFGIPCSDDAIRRWRSTIDRAYYVPITLERRRQLAALVELFGSSSDAWKRPELAITLDRESGMSATRSRLMDIGLGTAHELGAAAVYMNLEGVGPSTGMLAQRGASFDQASELVVVPARSLFHERLI